MQQPDFDGSIILEKLASVDLVDEFFEAIDSDDIVKVVFLLREADVEEDLIKEIIEELGDFG